LGGWLVGQSVGRSFHEPVSHALVMWDKVLWVVWRKIYVLWDMMKIWTTWTHKMVAVSSSKMFVTIYQSTRPHIQENKFSVAVDAVLGYYTAC